MRNHWQYIWNRYWSYTLLNSLKATSTNDQSYFFNYSTWIYRTASTDHVKTRTSRKYTFNVNDTNFNSHTFWSSLSVDAWNKMYAGENGKCASMITEFIDDMKWQHVFNGDLPRNWCALPMVNCLFRSFKVNEQPTIMRFKSTVTVVLMMVSILKHFISE